MNISLPLEIYNAKATAKSKNNFRVICFLQGLYDEI